MREIRRRSRSRPRAGRTPGDRRRQRAEPRPLAGSRDRAGAVRALRPDGRAAAQEGGRLGPRGRGGPGARREPALPRRQLRHRGAHHGALHRAGPRRRAGRGGAGAQARGAASCSWSTCARPSPAWPAGRTACTAPGTCSATAATATATRCARSRTSPLELERSERGEIPKAVPLVRPMVSGSARAGPDGTLVADPTKEPAVTAQPRLAALIVAAVPSPRRPARRPPPSARPPPSRATARATPCRWWAAATRPTAPCRSRATARADRHGHGRRRRQLRRLRLGAPRSAQPAQRVRPTRPPTRPTPANVGTSPPEPLSPLRVGVTAPGRAQPAPPSPREDPRLDAPRHERVRAHPPRRATGATSRGQAQGACRTSSKRVRLFGRGASPGVYRVQFDTFKRVRAQRAQRVIFRVTIFRTFRRSSASGASELARPSAGQRRSR